MTIVDVQFSPANCDWSELRDAAIAAEQQGFGAVWAFDHLAGVALGGHTMLEAFALLGALAEATTTIELGLLVANVWNRQPGTLLSAAASVTRISGRQFHLGVGAGASPRSKFAAEQIATNAYIADSIDERHARVEEVLTLARSAWTAGTPASLSTFPIPFPAPTLIVGVNSVKLSCIAGTLADGINVQWAHPRRDEFLDAAERAAQGRPFQRTVWTHFDRALLDPEHPVRIQMADARIDRLILADLGRPSLSRSA